MQKRAAPKPGAFSLAVRDQLLLEMNRKGFSSLKLSRTVPRGKSYLAERFSSNDKDFTLTDVELICEALNVDINSITQNAVSQIRSANQVIDNFALAAYEGEDDMGVDHYEG